MKGPDNLYPDTLVLEIFIPARLVGTIILALARQLASRKLATLRPL